MIASLRANLILDDSIQNHFNSPISIYSGSDRFTQIAVDPQVYFL